MTYRETESRQHTVALFGIANVSDPGFLRIAPGGTHRHAEDTRIRAVNDNVASIDDRTPQRLACVVPSGNIDRDGYTDECKRQHAVCRERDFSAPGYFSCFLRRVRHCANRLARCTPLLFMTGSKVCFDVDQIPSTPAFVLFGRRNPCGSVVAG